MKKLKKIVFNPVTRRFSYDDDDIVYRLVDTLNDNWDYGVLKGSRKITDLSNFDFEKDYRTIPINKLKEYKIGLCWDFVNWEHYVLDKHKIKHKCYFIFIDLNNGHYITHTFVIVELNGKKLWIESALYKYRGVHEVTGLNDVIKTAFSDHSHYDIYEYNPNGLDKNLTDKEFVDKATKKLVYTTDDKSFSTGTELTDIIKFNDYLNKFYYGYPLSPHKNDYGLDPLGFNGSKVDEYEKYYKILSPSDFLKYRMGFCTDFTLFEADYFRKNFKDIPFTTFNVRAVDDKYQAAHDFLVFKYGDKYYWFESSLNKLGLGGIHEYDNLRKLLTDFCMISYNNKLGSVYEIRETNMDSKVISEMTQKKYNRYLNSLDIVGRKIIISKGNHMGYVDISKCKI